MITRDALLALPPDERDAFVDRALGIREVPDDGPELPKGGVPYLPCPVSVLVRLSERVHATDVVLDLGAGIGRAAAVVHLLTGAEVVGIEVQSALVAEARALLTRNGVCGVRILHGDAVEADLSRSTVLFLYCPFSGERLERVLDRLAQVPRPILVATVDLPLPPCDWLTLEEDAEGLAVYRSRP